MEGKIYIRPLVIEDALTSYKWRNNAKLWRLTGSRPDKVITPEIETDWLADVLKRTNEKRFAICLSDNDQYIGNVFLTNIENGQGILHTFIGETDYWGGGRALEAVKQLLKYAFENLNLQSIVAEVNKKNVASLSLGKNAGFRDDGEFIDKDTQIEFFKIIYTLEMYQQARIASIP